MRYAQACDRPQVLAILRTIDGDVATAQSNLALLLQGMGQVHEAEMMHLNALAVRESSGPSYQRDTGDSLANLAALLRAGPDLAMADGWAVPLER